MQLLGFTQLQRRIAENPLGLYLLLVLLVSLPATVALYSSRKQVSQDAEKAATQETAEAARVAAILLEQQFEQGVTFLEAYARSAPLREQLQRRIPKAQALAGHLAGAYELRSDFVSFGVYDPEGTLLAVYPPDERLEKVDYSFRDWYRGVSREWKPYVSEAFETAAVPDSKVYAIAVPIREQDSGGRILGILVALNDLRTIGQWLEKSGHGVARATLIVDKNGQIAAHSVKAGSEPVALRSYEPFQRASSGKSGGGTYARGGVERFVAFEPISHYGWAVLVEEPATSVHAGLWALDRQQRFLGLVLAALAMGSVILLASLYRQLEVGDQFLRLSKDMFCVAGADGKFKYVSPSWTRTLGFKQGELLSKPFLDFVHPEDRKITAEAARAIVEEGKAPLFENRYRSSDGSYRWLAWNSVLVPKRGLIYAVARDITERRKDQERIREQNRELEQRNREIERATKLKSQFLASMSHELRTPLTAILGFTGLLIDQIAGPLNEKQGRYAEHIRNGANHLLRLINDILDLSKVEAGQIELHQESFALAEALPEVLSLIRPLVMKKKVRLESQTSDARIYADRVRFKQILYNLLSNATKFTPEGGVIRLACSREDAQVKISVSDTGIGIAPEDQRVIFEEFRQVGPTTGGLKEGSGLGLTITRRLLEQQGGRIWVESQVGQGSCFTFTLPVGAAVSEVTRRPADPLEQHAAEAPLVLIVEGEESARELLVGYLQPEGYRTVTCGPGTPAVETAAKLRPDAITLNTLTPGHGGWETLASLKINPATREIPIIIVSVVDQRKMGFAMGAAEYLVKPVARPELLRAVQKWVPQQKGASILVTDDDPAVVEMVRDCLTKAGYRVLTAFDGRQALRLLGQQHPDALVLDLMMPEVDGFEVIAQVRQNPHLRELPILVLTAKDLTEADRELLSRETRALFRKESSWREDLLRQINQVVRRRKCAMEVK